MYKYFSQLDHRWAIYPIGKTKLCLGRYGCTICSLCTMFSRFGVNITPIEASCKWAFTDKSYPKGEGNIIWNKTDWGKAKFEGRYYCYDEKSLRTWIALPNHGAVIQADDFHWLAVDKFSKFGFGLLAIDPLGGIQIRPLKKYHKITGMAYFTINK